MNYTRKVTDFSDLELIIFDFDRTLCRLFSDAESAELVDDMRAQGIVKSTGQHRDPYSIWSDIRRSVLADPNNIDARQTEYRVRRFLAIAEQAKARSVEPYQATRSFFDDLLPGLSVKVAVVSNNDYTAVDLALTRWNIRAQVNELNCRGPDTPVSDLKPSPEPILSCMRKLRVGYNSHGTNNRVLYVGDSLEDCQSSAEANVKFVACLSGNYLLKDFEGCPVFDHIQSIDGLRNLLTGRP